MVRLKQEVVGTVQRFDEGNHNLPNRSNCKLTGSAHDTKYSMGWSASTNGSDVSLSRGFWEFDCFCISYKRGGMRREREREKGREIGMAVFPCPLF